MRLEKYHGLGNDFLVLLDFDGRHPLGAEEVRALCDRHRGVGADGVIRVTPGPAMELYNADGGRAETSGNGIRCLARAVVDAGLAQGPNLSVRTDAGVRDVRIGDDGLVSVDMGTPAVHQSADGDVPAGALRAARVDMGNLHLVVLVDGDPGPEVVVYAARRAVVDGLNVEVATVGPEAGRITMRVWERGVGETRACGTGACAAAAAARSWGLADDHVVVHQPGGDLRVNLTGDTVVLTGPAVHVCSVEVA
jgi:diaminopimelate epimerase